MYDLLHDLPRGNYLEEKSPDASFAKTKSIVDDSSLAFLPGSIFLGAVNADIRSKELKNNRLELHAIGGHLVGTSDEGHIITVAGSRAGKGRSVIVPNLCTYPGSVLVIDPKGDLARITARHRFEGLGHEIHALDPFNTTRGECKRFISSFNPISILHRDSETIVEDAGLIADAIVVPSGNDTHWDDTARNFIEGVILHVATAKQHEGERSLKTVYDLIMKIGHKDDSLQDEMEENTDVGTAISNAAIDFFGKGENERASVLSTVRRHVRFLGYKKIQNVLGKSTFDLKDLKRKPITIYLSLPAMRMGTCFRWLRLFVNLTLAAMEESEVKPEWPVLMILDEFAVLGHMKTIEDAAGQIAGLGCKLWPIIQDLGQLKALYHERWETFMGNAGILQFFGNNDITTLEWISKRLGQTTIRTENYSSPSYKERAKTGSKGISSNMQVHDLLTPEEVSRFFGRDDICRRQLVIRAGPLPMILQRINYDTHEYFEGKFDDIFKNEARKA